MSSSIIKDNEEVSKCLSLCEISCQTKWKLVYRATRDGFSAESFHSKCKNTNQPTLTIVETTNSYVFGGYTESDWTAINNYKTDKNAFLFSFINKLNLPVKLNCIQSYSSIFAHSEFLPTFGGGHDIFICNNSNLIEASCSNLGFSYKHPCYAFSTDEAKTFLAGSHYFLTKEVEVFALEV